MSGDQNVGRDIASCPDVHVVFEPHVEALSCILILQEQTMVGWALNRLLCFGTG